MSDLIRPYRGLWTTQTERQTDTVSSYGAIHFHVSVQNIS